MIGAALAYLPIPASPRPAQPRQQPRRINASPFSRQPRVHPKPRQGVKNFAPRYAPGRVFKTHANPPGIIPVAAEPAVWCSVAAERGGLEAAYQARYASGYERAVVDVDARIASGDLRNLTRQPDHLFRANEIDRFARDDLRLFAQSQGHGSDLVRINQRLYLEGTSGSYRVPDLYFPQSRTIFDGTLGTKSLTTPQIRDFRIATGNAPVGIVRPEANGGFYWIGN